MLCVTAVAMINVLTLCQKLDYNNLSPWNPLKGDKKPFYAAMNIDVIFYFIFMLIIAT